jgi:SAM-dependent methyltransferase
MKPTSSAERAPVPSIFTVYKPIEQYWEEADPTWGLENDAWSALNPLDAFLVYRLIELLDKRTTVVDRATAATGGASSLVSLLHPNVREVWAADEVATPRFARAIAELRGYLEEHEPGAAALKVARPSELLARARGRAGLVILADARSQEGASLAVEVASWLEARPDALVMVLTLGPVGACPAFAALVGLCAPESGLRLHHLRDVSDALLASRLVLVARADHSDLALVLARLAQSYTGNHGYLELLRQVNGNALCDATLDEHVLRNHATFGPISVEMEELKRLAREANDREAATARALAEAHVQLQAMLPAIHRFIAWSRRKLAPTPVGAVYRAAKRLRTRLSPTPIGAAYRTAKQLGRNGVAVLKRQERHVALMKALRAGWTTGSRKPTESRVLQVIAPAVARAAEPSPFGPVAVARAAERLAAGAARLELLSPLLACPACRESLEVDSHSLHCEGCQARYPLQGGRPVFVTDRGQPVFGPARRRHEPPPGETVEWMTWFDGLILNIGAGETAVKLENVVELDDELLRHTDLAAHAHALPFADGSFDAVLSFDLFGRIDEPEHAIAEIFRVLKPGGELVVRSALPQSLHVSHLEIQSLSDRGLKRWFSEFEVTRVAVTGHFDLPRMIGRLAGDLLRAVETTHGREARDAVGARPLDYWSSGGEDDAVCADPVWEMLQGLPRRDELHFAFDFQLEARKPGAVATSAA